MEWGPLYARWGSTVVAVVAETALLRDTVRSQANHLPPQHDHLRGQHGSKDALREAKHVGTIVWWREMTVVGRLSDQLRRSAAMREKGGKASDVTPPFMLASSAPARLTDA